jgi:hypothetical protein
VFPARYELNSYIVFRKRLVSRRLIFRVSSFISFYSFSEHYRIRIYLACPLLLSDLIYIAESAIWICIIAFPCALSLSKLSSSIGFPPHLHNAVSLEARGV